MRTASGVGIVHFCGGEVLYPCATLTFMGGARGVKHSNSSKRELDIKVGVSQPPPPACDFLFW